MKKFFLAVLIIALIASLAYILLLKKGYNEESILNMPQTIDLSVDCSQVKNLLFTSVVTVNVQNNSSRTHNNVMIRLTAYDKKENIIKEKDITFNRTLGPNSSFSKPVTLPGKARTCNCVVLSSEPN